MADTRTGPVTVRVFRVIAVLEATSWLILIVATIVKYATHPHRQLGVQIMGPIHGALFTAYVVLALIWVRPRARWNLRATAVVIVESVVPFGGYAAARRPEIASAA